MNRFITEDYCAEEELARLVNIALEYNHSSEELKEALIKESWEGTVICVFLVLVTKFCSVVSISCTDK